MYMIKTHNMNPSEVKKQVRMAHQCPICKTMVKFGIERGFLENAEKFPFTHVVLHGNPVHALIAYIDANMQVRGVEKSTSIEISRDQATFSQLIKKWSNPF
jgi:hypothetical protein